MAVYDCSDVRAGALLAELVNSAKPLGMGFFAVASAAQQMTEEDASRELAISLRTDYVRGRPIKTDFTDMTAVSSRLYDRDAGQGAFLAALERVRRGLITQAEDYRKSDAELQAILAHCDQNVQVVALGSCPRDLGLKKFDKVWFTEDFVKRLQIPYPSDWCMYMGTNDGKAVFMGSMGGRFAIEDTAPVIARHESL